MLAIQAVYRRQLSEVHYLHKWIKFVDVQNEYLQMALNNLNIRFYLTHSFFGLYFGHQTSIIMMVSYKRHPINYSKVKL